MDGEKGKGADKEDKQKKSLLGILIALGVIMLGLIVGIVVVNVTNNHDEEIVQPAADDEVTIEQIRQYIAAMDKKIKKTRNSEKKAELYTERADFIVNYAVEWDDAELKDQALSDVYAAEKLNPTAMAAYNISYYEELFGDEAKAEQYRNTAEKRGLSDEIKDTWK